MQRFNDHSQDKLLSFAGTGAITLYSNCENFCKAICEGSSPSFQGATETPFFKGIKDQLLFFAELEVAAGSSSAARIIRGKDAVQLQYNKVLQLEQAPTHPDLTMLTVFGWCLTKVEADKVKEWRDRASANEGNVASAGSAADAQSVPKAGTSKARQANAKHLDEMTKTRLSRGED